MGNVIEFRNITKYFPGVKALDDISITANGGEVLALAHKVQEAVRAKFGVEIAAEVNVL